MVTERGAETTEISGVDLLSKLDGAGILPADNGITAGALQKQAIIASEALGRDDHMPGVYTGMNSVLESNIKADLGPAIETPDVKGQWNAVNPAQEELTATVDFIKTPGGVSPS